MDERSFEEDIENDISNVGSKVKAFIREKCVEKLKDTENWERWTVHPIISKRTGRPHAKNSFFVLWNKKIQLGWTCSCQWMKKIHEKKKFYQRPCVHIQAVLLEKKGENVSLRNWKVNSVLEDVKRAMYRNYMIQEGEEQE